MRWGSEMKGKQGMQRIRISGDHKALSAAAALIAQRIGLYGIRMNRTRISAWWSGRWVAARRGTSFGFARRRCQDRLHGCSDENEGRTFITRIPYYSCSAHIRPRQSPVVPDLRRSADAPARLVFHTGFRKRGLSYTHTTCYPATANAIQWEIHDRAAHVLRIWISDHRR